MCRHAWQLLGMLGNILGRPRHALQRPRHALQCPRRPRHALLQGPRSPTSKKTPPHLLPYKLWSQGSSVLLSFHIWNLVVHYSLGFTAYKAASGGVYLRCGTPRTLRKGMSRTLRSMPRRPRTLPSMPRSCQASLHILGSHKYIFKK